MKDNRQVMKKYVNYPRWDKITNYEESCTKKRAFAQINSF